MTRILKSRRRTSKRAKKKKNSRMRETSRTRDNCNLTVYFFCFMYVRRKLSCQSEIFYSGYKNLVVPFHCNHYLFSFPDGRNTKKPKWESCYFNFFPFPGKTRCRRQYNLGCEWWNRWNNRHERTWCLGHVLSQGSDSQDLHRGKLKLTGFDRE